MELRSGKVISSHTSQASLFQNKELSRSGRVNSWLPAPPPSVPSTQLKMWSTIIQRRKQQISKLSNSHLLSFANDIILDLLSSQENNNEEQEGSREQGAVTTNPLLITGYYSKCLLMEHLSPANISINDVILHLSALFYRSVDARLTSVSRLQESRRTLAMLLLYFYFASFL